MHLTFWIRHVLRATTACTFATAQRPKVLRPCFAHFDLHTCFAPAAYIFSTSQLAKILRDWGVWSILTSKCASRHSLTSACHFWSHLTALTSAFPFVNIVKSLISKLLSIIITHTHAHTYIYIYIYLSIYLSIYLYLHTCTSPDVPGRSCWMPTRRVRRMWRSQTTIVAWSESAIFGSDGPPGRWGFLRNIK